MKTTCEYPTQSEIIQIIGDNFYKARIINNAHRGNVVEAMVLAALGPKWRLVGLGWHPWDLQRGTGKSRVRIQVKQSAALQLWGKTKNQSLQFGWKRNPPSYFKRDNPHEPIEAEGWFCDVFIFGVHQGTNPKTVQQTDASQWEFMVIPTSDLKKGTNSMVLTRALERWPLISWHDLSATVETAIKSLR